MRRLIFPVLALIAAIVVGCSSAAPPAPIGLARHPANGPEAIASLARAPAAPTAAAVAANDVQPTAPPTQVPSAPPPPPISTVIVLSDQTAPRGIASLSPTEQAKLVATARSAGSIRILCRGDRLRPSPAIRAQLLRRGAAIKRFLVAQGIAPAKIRLFVRSAGAFVADNSTSVGRARNRRVEIQFV